MARQGIHAVHLSPGQVFYGSGSFHRRPPSPPFVPPPCRSATCMLSSRRHLLWREVFGDETADKLLSDAQWDKDVLWQMSNINAFKQTAALEQLVHRFMDQFTAHMEEEETRLLPKLGQHPGVDMVALGMQFDAAGEHAVTRPHPWAPNKPPYNWVANRLAAPLDKFADMFRFGGYVPTVNAPASVRH